MTVCFKGRINFFTLLLVCTSLTLTSSCRKTEETVGNDFVGDIVGFDVKSSDTSGVIAYTSSGDSIINGPDEGMYYFHLGSMSDPDFGTTIASPVMEFALPISGSTFDFTNATIDSIVLQVKYVSANSYYGNINTPQTLRVYELTESLNADSAYATNRPFSHGTTAIGSWQGKFDRMGDSVKYTYAGAAVSLPPHLRIKLDDAAFVQKFKDAKDAGAFSDNNAFQNYFKGLIIAPETTPLGLGDGAIAYIQLRNGSDFSNITTSVVVFYDGSKKIEFPIYTDNNAKAAYIQHEHNITLPIQPLMGGSHQDVNYVQSLGGLKTRILIPNLFDFVKNQNIALTRAELIVTAAAGRDAAPYTVPPNLRLEESDSLGRNNYSTDLLLGGPNYYGGVYNSSTAQYTFSVTRYIQYLLKEYKQKGLNHNYGFNLYVQTNPASASRIVVDTRPGKVKLKLSYTVIN